jgi:hypothetical protein
MHLFDLVGFLLVCSVEQTAALALFGRRGLDQKAAGDAVDKRSLFAEVLAPSLATIYSTGDVTKRKTAGFGFNFQVDYQFNLWGFCPTTLTDPQACMVGSCRDTESCSKGCGLTTVTGLSSLVW